MEYLFLVGRIIVGGYFIMSGINHFTMLDMMTQYAESKGVPLAKLGVIISGIMLLAGGLSILLGYRTKIGILNLVVCLLIITFYMHRFWGIEDQNIRMMEMINFLKNLALIGLLLMGLGIPEPWRFSLGK